MLMCAILLAIFGSFGMDRNTPALAEVNGQKIVYLTFDDGPSDRVTPKILDTLKEKKVKATFFVVGRNAERRMGLLSREINEGHAVGVHSYSHEYKKIYSSPQSLIKDIDDCNRVIEKALGKKSRLYRFPGGSYGLSDGMISAVTAHGMRYIDWNASMRDAEIVGAAPSQLLEAAVKTSANADTVVLLAHDSTDKTATAQALPSVIEYYKSNGYDFCTFK